MLPSASVAVTNEMKHPGSLPGRKKARRGRLGVHGNGTKCVSEGFDLGWLAHAPQRRDMVLGKPRERNFATPA